MRTFQRARNVSLRERLASFLFHPDSGQWIGFLRIGLGLQVILYTMSLRRDWGFIPAMEGHERVVRSLFDLFLSDQTVLTPRLGWLVHIGASLGVTEESVFLLVWLCLLLTGVLLITGLFCRLGAIAAWFLYLSSVKSSELYSYGVDNFTIIGLFYLMIAPLPDKWSLDWQWRRQVSLDPVRLGFHRRVLQLHICLIYFFGGLTKALGIDWWTGVSVWRALTRLPFNIISPSYLIVAEPIFLVLGIAVVLLEFSYPFLIWPRRTRNFWLAGILGMHFFIGLTMGLYLFALIMIILNVAAFGPDICPRLNKGFLLHRQAGKVRT